MRFPTYGTRRVRILWQVLFVLLYLIVVISVRTVPMVSRLIIATLKRRITLVIFPWSLTIIIQRPLAMLLIIIQVFDRINNLINISETEIQNKLPITVTYSPLESVGLLL
ncbi:hypothetical protein HanRHA438_Chr00c06g0845761 [Helianthus annuus]|nr:hypothetical protein HanRHA438_Chr00c06g0845761 [Helianthus annuus]